MDEINIGETYYILYRKRSQDKAEHLTWDRMKRLVASWIPPARICHPYPLVALWRYYLRQEPDEVVPQVRICAGGAG